MACAVKAMIGTRSYGEVNRRLVLYALCLGGVRVWGLANRLHAAVHPNTPMFALYALHAFFSPLQGLCNALVYGFSKRLRDHYRVVCAADPQHEIEQVIGSAMRSDALILTSPPPPPDAAQL